MFGWIFTHNPAYAENIDQTNFKPQAGKVDSMAKYVESFFLPIKYFNGAQFRIGKFVVLAPEKIPDQFGPTTIYADDTEKIVINVYKSATQVKTDSDGHEWACAEFGVMRTNYAVPDKQLHKGVRGNVCTDLENGVAAVVILNYREEGPQ